MRKLALLIMALLVCTLFATDRIYGQENQEKNKQKELQKKQQKELDSITEKAQAESEDELKQLFEEQKKAQAESKELFEELDRNHQRENRKVIRNYDGYRNKVYVQPNPFFVGSGNNTTFTISKNLKDVFTFSSDFEYEVPENVTGLYFTFSSELEKGSLKVTITKPGGKVFQVFSVDPVANVDWNKQLKIKETEVKDYSGTWKITISTKEAKGYYELKLNSN